MPDTYPQRIFPVPDIVDDAFPFFPCPLGKHDGRHLPFDQIHTYADAGDPADVIAGYYRAPVVAIQLVLDRYDPGTHTFKKPTDV
jgi:hypothetical protein